MKSATWEQFDFESESAVLASAEILYESGCGEPQKIELVNHPEDVYILALSDIDGKVFHFTMDAQGYIGPVTDDDGNYLYSPMD